MIHYAFCKDRLAKMAHDKLASRIRETATHYRRRKQFHCMSSERLEVALRQQSASLPIPNDLVQRLDV